MVRSLRADQVGSLLRPPALRQAFARRDAGEIDDAELRDAQDEAIRAVIASQEAHGLPVLTDGEFRRLNFQDSFGASVAGFEQGDTSARFNADRARGGAPLRRWNLDLGRSGPAVVTRRAAVERLRMVENRPLAEYRFASGLTARSVKVTLIGPDRILQRFAWERSRPVYDGLDAFAADVVAIERQMLDGLAAAGCPYVQIDAPGLTAYVDPPSLQQMRERGEDPEQNLQRAIAAENAVVVAFPQLVTGIHLCRGNQRSMWHREGAYDAIAERLFTSLAHDRFLLEYDTERAGGFAPLRFVPKGKVVVLGLISSKVPQLEDADELLRRIEAASRFLPIEQLAISPQCGFASDLGGNLLDEASQWRKLELMLEVARRVWGGVTSAECVA